MKIVQCESCGDFILPRAEMAPEWCSCMFCCTWWRIAQHGLLSVWHVKSPNCCSVVGISNRFWNVMIPESGVLAESDVFSEMNHAIVRVRPGVHDVLFEEPKFLPEWEKLKEKLVLALAEKEKYFEPRSASHRSIGSLLWGKK